MAPSDGQISLTCGATEVSFTAPDAGYLTKIELPFDVVKLDDGTFETRDEGTQYDKRTCELSFHLPAAEISALTTLLSATGRGQDLVLSLPSGSGFFPFGPDKGDDGPFTVAARLRGTPAISLSPYRYFRVELELRNVGSWPAYALPSEVAEGGFTIGTVTELRMPQALFVPDQTYQVSVNFGEANASNYFDRGSGGDVARTAFALQCNESKCAALLAYLTGTARIGAFNVITADQFYAFGADHGASGTYSVRMARNAVDVKNLRHNEYELSLELQRIS